MSKKKKILIIVVVLLLFIVVPIALYLFFNKPGNPQSYIDQQAVLMSRDKDTGERVDYDKNRVSEENGNTQVLILGMEELIRKGVLSPQVRVIREQLSTYAEQRLNNKYISITLRPQDMTIQDGTILSSIRLGDTETYLPVIITAKNTGETQVQVNDPDNVAGGSYTGELVTIAAD